MGRHTHTHKEPVNTHLVLYLIQHLSLPVDEQREVHEHLVQLDNRSLQSPHVVVRVFHLVQD